MGGGLFGGQEDTGGAVVLGGGSARQASWWPSVSGSLGTNPGGTWPLHTTQQKKNMGSR